jgi:hypothetical protein
MATVKKVVSKKASKTGGTKTPKRVVQRDHRKAKRVLVCAQGEQCFWTTDGKIVANLVELRDALTTMATEVFEYHVTKDKNDFADWIEYVLGDAELAQRVRGAKKPTSARTFVVARLKKYDI